MYVVSCMGIAVANVSYLLFCLYYVLYVLYCVGELFVEVFVICLDVVAVCFNLGSLFIA